MREELFEEILSLVEEYINELDDETVNNSAEKRKENEVKAIDKYLEAVKRNKGNYDTEEVQQAREEGRIAREKYQKNQDLRNKRNKRMEKKLSDFKEKLINKKPQTPKQTQQAGSDHANAMIDQHFRNKLEKAFSNECFESLISLIEGELIDFQKKRKEIILDKNAKKMAKMMQDGTLNAVRVLPNNELIGDPIAIKMVKDIQKENNEVRKAVHEGDNPSYIDKEGATQFQLFPTDMTGKNLQQEQSNKTEKTQKPKNPNRVEGGKKARQTRLQNTKDEFVNRPIFKALNYNPYENGENNG